MSTKISGRGGWAYRIVLALALFALTAGSAAAQDRGSYGYLRIVEGSATVTQAGSEDPTPADVNQPVLVGDHISVADRSRVELVLADRNLVRLDAGSELLLERLAASPDAGDRATVLRLLEGNMQVVVSRDSLGDELPRLETADATIFPQDFGVYRVTTDQGGWTEVTVRRGKAEVQTGGGSETLEADERAVIEGGDRGDRRAGLDVQDAGGLDNLERWAQRLDQEDEQADLGPVDEDLRYSAAPLNRYGSWVTIEDQSYWRPRVAAGWRPYGDGRWVYTPSGMTWVSYEPWGWVPYHYGSWDFLTSYGWVWRPGAVYSPAWVYWYWGTSYAGWCPIGYYSHYYGGRFGYAGFHSGVYGWAGGDWGLFADWNFVPTSYFRGYRDGYRHGYWNGRHDSWRSQWNVKRYAVSVGGRHGPLERGIITTDTRPLKPETWSDPRRAVRVLSDQPTARKIAGKNGGGELADVTPFIARKRELPPTVTRAIVADGKGNQIDGTPLRPGTLGKGGRGDRDARGARVMPEAKPGMPRVIADDAPRSGRRVPDAQGGAPRPDFNPVLNKGPRVIPGQPDAKGEPGIGGQRSPRSARPDAGDAGDAVDKGGAPRPDRGDRGDNGRGQRVIPAEPKGEDTPSVRTPRNTRPNRGRESDEGDKGGAPRPDRGGKDRGEDNGRGSRAVPEDKPPEDKPPASANRPFYSTPRSTWSRPDDRGGAPRPEPSVRTLPTRPQSPQPRYDTDRPAYRRPDPTPSRTYGGGEDKGGNRGAYERPAYDPPRPAWSRPAERSMPAPPSPKAEPQERAPERSARPSSDRPPEGRSSGGRERSSSGDKGGGNRGHRGHGDDGNEEKN